MVTGFCIQNKYWLDSISDWWRSSDLDSIDNSEFPGDQSGHCKPGEKPEDGVIGRGVSCEW